MASDLNAKARDLAQELAQAIACNDYTPEGRPDVPAIRSRILAELAQWDAPADAAAFQSVREDTLREIATLADETLAGKGPLWRDPDDGANDILERLPGAIRALIAEPASEVNQSISDDKIRDEIGWIIGECRRDGLRDVEDYASRIWPAIRALITAPGTPDSGECPICGYRDGHDDCDRGLSCPYADDTLRAAIAPPVPDDPTVAFMKLPLPLSLMEYGPLTASLSLRFSTPAARGEFVSAIRDAIAGKHP